MHRQDPSACVGRLDVAVSGTDGVPADAAAVILNVTVTATVSSAEKVTLYNSPGFAGVLVGVVGWYG